MSIKDIVILEYKTVELTKKPGFIDDEEDISEVKVNWEALGLTDPNPQMKPGRSITDMYDITYKWGLKTFVKNEITSVEKLSDEDEEVLIYLGKVPFIVRGTFKKALKLIYNKK